MINRKTYDVLKFIAQIGLPALGTLIFAIFQIWGLKHGSEVVGTIMAVDLFLGTLLGISTQQFNKSVAGGQIVLGPPGKGGKKNYQLVMDDDPEQLEHGVREVRFQVKKKGSEVQAGRKNR